jgi:opacity protein-like surface antigen
LTIHNDFIYFILIIKFKEKVMKSLKKLTLVFAFILASTFAFAEESNINFKVGAQFPDAPDKTGFDSAISFNFGADKYFTIGVEAGFGWVKWKDSGAATEIDGVPLQEVDKTNLYSFPLLAVATIRLADMKEQYGFMPYVTGGAGYSWTIFDNPDLPDEFDKTFSGFTWQVVGGVSFLLGSGSNMMFIVEAGWRSAEVDNSNNLQLDMSGPIVRAGVSFPLELSSY